MREKMGGIHLWNFIVHILLYVKNKLMKPNSAVKKAVTNIDYIKGL